MAVKTEVDGPDRRARRDSAVSAAARQTNDRLARLSRTARTPVRVFLCECDDPCCAESVEVAIATYRAIRARTNRHLVAPGHALIGPQQVIVASRGFHVLEQPARISTPVTLEPA